MPVHGGLARALKPELDRAVNVTLSVVCPAAARPRESWTGASQKLQLERFILRRAQKGAGRVGGRRIHLGFSAPRLYLASGTTTIRTAGTTIPYAEINTRTDIDRGEIPGPRIHLTAPYATGGSRTSDHEMAFLDSPEAARRFLAYWAAEGATWIKASFEIRRAELQAVIEEAHRRGVKVTGHLCAVTAREAVELGINDLEHGFTILSELDPEKRPDTCAPYSGPRVGKTADPTGEGARAAMRGMIENRVALTSTLAVFESLIPRRPVVDPRGLEAMPRCARRISRDVPRSTPARPGPTPPPW